MNKKDILFMCQFFYPEYITSALLPYQTAEKLANMGYKVSVLCGYPKEYMSELKRPVAKHEKINGIEIKRVKYLQLSRGNKLSRLINYFSFVFSMLFKIHEIRHYKSIIIYSNPPILPIVALIANKLFGTKIIFVCYDVYPEIAVNTGIISKGSIIDKIMSAINKSLYKNASKIIALSNEMREFIIKNRDVDAEKVEVIPNWDTNSPDNSISNTRIKSSNELVVTYLGNMGIPQDFDALLEVMNDTEIKQKNIKFIFAGHGNKKDMIKDYIEKHKIKNVELHGYLQGNDFQVILDKTDAFILSLKDNLNGLAVPSKFYTYLSNNKPIIAIINQHSDIAKEIKEFNIGGSFSNGNATELKSYISDLYVGFNLIDYTDLYVNYYSKEIQLEKYCVMINSMLGGNSNV